MAFRSGRSLLLCILLIASSPASAAWEGGSDWSKPSSKNAVVDRLGLYAVEIRCSPRGGSLKSVTDAWTGKTRSLLVVINKAVGTGTPAADKLPTDAIGAVQAYSASSKDWTSFDYRDCKKDFLVAGSRFALTAVKNESNDPAGGPIGQFVSGLLGVVSPLFSLFTGQALPAAIATKITNLQTASDPIGKMLAALKSGENTTKPIDVLRTGTYRYVTDHAAINVTVRRVTSIVLDKNTNFRDDLRAQVKAAPEKIDSSKLEQSCRAARLSIPDLGFRSTLDVAYGMIALAGKAGINNNQTIECLTRPYAEAITKIPNQDKIIWSDFQNEQRFTQENVDLVVPVDPTKVQPKYAVISSRVDSLVTALAQYARNDPHPKQATDDLVNLLSEDIAVTDKTSNLIVGGNGSYKRLDFIAKLTEENVTPLPEKRFIRFGCYAETKDASGLAIDGAPAIFLVFKTKNDDSAVQFEDVLAIKPLFDTKTKSINGMIVSPDRGWIGQVLIDRSYNCNDFLVKKPA